jgi:hypothetical protein
MSLGRGFHWLMIFNAALTFAAAVLLTISPDNPGDGWLPSTFVVTRLLMPRPGGRR